jgi:hypothetical protein
LNVPLVGAGGASQIRDLSTRRLERAVVFFCKLFGDLLGALITAGLEQRGRSVTGRSRVEQIGDVVKVRAAGEERRICVEFRLMRCASSLVSG